MSDDLLSPPPGKPLWLVTLADLALLLVGFLVLIQATTDRAALARGIREGFGASEAAPPPVPPMPVDAVAAAFAPGVATLAEPAPLIAWARQALRDPRITLAVTGSATPDEGVLLAADRARAALAALIAAGLPADRLQLATARAGGRRVTLSLAFGGEPKDPR